MLVSIDSYLKYSKSIVCVDTSIINILKKKKKSENILFVIIVVYLFIYFISNKPILLKA
jgi:hypothetical protein